MSKVIIRHRLLDRLLEWRGFLGASFLPCVIFLHRKAPPEIYRHEMVHQKQLWRYWVVGFWVLYLYQLVKYGYRKMPLEIEARKGEQ